MTNTSNVNVRALALEVLIKVLEEGEYSSGVLQNVLKVYQEANINLPTLEKDNKLVDIDNVASFDGDEVCYFGQNARSVRAIQQQFCSRIHYFIFFIFRSCLKIEPQR